MNESAKRTSVARSFQSVGAARLIFKTLELAMSMKVLFCCSVYLCWWNALIQFWSLQLDALSVIFEIPGHTFCVKNENNDKNKNYKNHDDDDEEEDDDSGNNATWWIDDEGVNLPPLFALYQFSCLKWWWWWCCCRWSVVAISWTVGRPSTADTAGDGVVVRLVQREWVPWCCAHRFVYHWLDASW